MSSTFVLSFSFFFLFLFLILSSPFFLSLFVNGPNGLIRCRTRLSYITTLLSESPVNKTYLKHGTSRLHLNREIGRTTKNKDTHVFRNSINILTVYNENG